MPPADPVTPPEARSTGAAPKAKATHRDRTVAERPRRRWLRRGAIALILLVIGALVLTQIVLWTDIPRSIVLPKLQAQLGLRVQARSMSAGWFGTTLHDVRISMPLAEQSVVEVPEMRVRYNWLPLLLILGPDIKSVDLDRPVLNVWQGTDGRWNLAEVMELIGRTGGKQTGDSGGSSPVPRLPTISISDATVNIAAAGGRKQQIGHVEIQGRPDASSLVWKYDVSVAGQISLVGKIAPGDTWANEVTLNVKPQAIDLLRAWVPNAPPFELLDGKWVGRIDGGGVAGRLDIGAIKIAGLAASGAVDASSQNGTVQLRPVNFVLDTGQPLIPRVVATGGALSYDGKNIMASGLQARLAGGQARIDASVDTAGSSGKVSMLWEGLTLSPGGAVGGPRTSGSLNGSFATRLAGHPEIRASLDTRGWLSATRNWDGKLQINGDGSSWQDIDWTIAAPTLNLTGQQLVALNGLNVRLHQQRQELALTSVTLGDSAARADLSTLRSLGGSGDFNFASQAWWIKLAGRGWPVPQIEDETIGFNLDAQATPELLRLNDASFCVSGTIARIAGTYVYADPAPVHMTLELTHKPDALPAKSLKVERANAIAAVEGATPTTAPVPELIDGDIDGAVSLTGKLKGGLALTMKGKLLGRDVRFRGLRIGDFDGIIDGNADDKSAGVHTDRFDFLGAKWNLSASYPFEAGATALDLSVEHLRLQHPGVRALLKRDDLAGDFSGHWNISMPGIVSRSEHLHGSGELNGSDLMAAGFTASDLHAGFKLENGVISVNPIELRRPAIEMVADDAYFPPPVLRGRVREGVPTPPPLTQPPPPPSPGVPGEGERADGRIRLGISMNLANPGHIEASNLNVDRWPLPLPAAGAALSVDGHGDSITIDLPNSAAPPGSPRRLFHMNSPAVVMTASILGMSGNGKATRLGNCDLNLQLQDRVADVRAFHAYLYDASLDAHALIDLDHPVLARADLHVHHVDFATIAKTAPALKSMHGRYDLDVGIAPAQSPNALEPLQIDVSLHSDGAKLGHMRLGDGRLRAYANVDPDWGLVRLVSEDLKPPSDAQKASTKCPPVRDDLAVANQNTIEIAGGMLRVWTRFVRNQDERGIKGATSLSSYIWVDFKCLDLNQLANATDAPRSTSVSGKLDGQVALYGTTEASMPEGNGAATQPPGPFQVRLVRSLHGDGSINLRDSDLGDFGPIAFLYNAMRIGSSQRGPTGTGDATFRVDGNQLLISTVHYFNRGVEVRAQGTIEKLASFPKCPLNATAVGTARPLKDLKLPFLRSLLPDVDQFLNALQGSTVSERISGELDDLNKLKIRPILFSEIGQGLRQLLLGDYKAEVQGSPGQ